MQSAWKVGLFVVAFVVLFLGAFAVLEQSVFAKPVDIYYAEFPDAGGVTTGSLVLLSGVKIGQVKYVRLEGANLAKMTLEIDRGIEIPEGTYANVPSSFISLGDTRVMLIAPDNAVAAMEPGSVIPGRLTSPIESFAPGGEKTLEEIQKTLVSIRGLLEDKGMRKDLQELMVSLKGTSDRFGSLATRVDSLVANNSGQVQALFRSTAGTLQNLQAVSLELRRLIASGEMQGRATALLDNLNAAVTQTKGLVADLQSLVADPELRASMKDTLANFKVMSDSGTRIAANAETMSANGIEITEETKTLMKKANKIADGIQDLIDKFNTTVGLLKGPGKSFVEGLDMEATLARETEPNRLRSDVNVFIPFGKEGLMFGLYDAFESNKVNLQLVKKLSPNLGLRYGAYASKPGVGVDYGLASKLGFRADLFGLNDPRLDFRLNYRFSPVVTGWAGVNNIFERNAPAIGVTVHK